MTIIDRSTKLGVSNQFSALVAALCLSLGSSAQNNHARYTLVDLGVEGPAGQPFHITNNGIVAAAVGTASGTDHAVIYFQGHAFDIGNPGLGGANSMALGDNGWGQVVGSANTRHADPRGEDFCGYQFLGLPLAANSCVPFLWQNGRMMALPTLDENRGNNGLANSINDLGEVAGTAETTSVDPGCAPYNPAGLQFQQYQFKPVVWKQKEVVELASVGGDPDGAAVTVNNKGQVAGSTGTCATYNIALGYPLHPLHAVLWEKDGTPIDLGSLGGSEHSAWGNDAEGLNNAGHVVGTSSLSDDTTFHAFLWTKERGKMLDLGTVPGIANSTAIAINDNDEVVGISLDDTHFTATLWKDGKTLDLNTVIPANSPLHLMSGCSINNRGQIIGFAVDQSGAVHGYELIPAGE